MDIDGKLKRAIFMRTVTWVTFFTAILLSLGILVVNAFISAQTRGALIDCTDPQGQCFKDGQKRTAVYITQLIEENRLGDLETQQVIIQASVCADEPSIRAEADKVDRIKLMEECINDGLKRSRDE